MILNQKKDLLSIFKRSHTTWLTCLLVVTMFFLLIPSPNAYAVLISADDPVFGLNSITLDTDTGLEWLDLTESQNRSFSDVASEFGPGGDFEGFRHVNEVEIIQLWTNAGIPDIGVGPTEANYTPIRELQDLIGVTDYDSFLVVWLTQGFFDDGSGGITTATANLYATGDTPGGAGAGAFTAGTSIFDGFVPDFPSSLFGNWLVRAEITSVPEPSSAMLLFSLCLICLAGFSRKKIKK